jgi:hypothetical protein
MDTTLRLAGRKASGPTRATIRELIMKKMMSSLIALSILAGIATSVAAATQEDEDSGNYWKQQERNLP